MITKGYPEREGIELTKTALIALLENIAGDYEMVFDAGIGATHTSWPIAIVTRQQVAIRGGYIVVVALGTTHVGGDVVYPGEGGG